jgi:hypothetical protein
MERVRGRQLSKVWDAMSEAQRFSLVKSLVEIEQKLVNVKFALHGSLYYKDMYPHSRGIIDPAELEQEATLNFVISPTTQRSFWEIKKHRLGIDQGPYTTLVCLFSFTVH